MPPGSADDASSMLRVPYNQGENYVCTVHVRHGPLTNGNDVEHLFLSETV